ncbi:glucose-6-phosphate dehydrogenase assembly protein OpcA [Bailinhaonella thermotolerans]|uniref:Oxidoreductase n=1 Tax=Bailinhaonella thermotolerans TaxID=1070861 RepID=A0A3A4B4P2_9ACTN|nr:glucose-6-phosphate dehydrogenase assembly protein OpcA [Bailinhaonella thermotolerans]RJL36121.1 oxidoreductase [Bailinhaonella thermotolerans]
MTQFTLTDTTSSAIVGTLTELRHRMGAPALGMVLTLVVVTEERDHYDAMRAAVEAGREHPSRIVVVIPRGAEEEETRLDAEVRVSESTPGEVVLLRLYGELIEHQDSVVSPLVLPDTPVVVWWASEAPPVPAEDPVGRLAQRRITDIVAGHFRPGPTETLRMLASRANGYRPGDGDLAWTRLTNWRTMIGSAFDTPVPPVQRGVVEAKPGNPSAELLAAWLSQRLGADVRVLPSQGPGITGVRLEAAGEEVAITRVDSRMAQLSRTGQPDRRVALARRATSELLKEELRHLDPDEVYEETLRHVAAEARTRDAFL